jgi:hypothetical protein
MKSRFESAPYEALSPNAALAGFSVLLFAINAWRFPKQ